MATINHPNEDEQKIIDGGTADVYVEFTDESKRIVVGEAEQRYRTEYEPYMETRTGGCLLWAAAAQWSLAKHFPTVKTTFGAGTTNFRFRATDDGVSATHFSYQFETFPALMRASQGMLPEMHVWLVVYPETCNPDVMELIDLTTGFQPKQMKKMLGFEWDKELLPPPYLWCKASHIPKEFHYEAHPVARTLAIGFLEDFHRRYGLEKTW